MHQVLAAAGRGIPTGTCPSVGAAGHALGGRLGAHSRHAGLMSDALRSATVVRPGGQTVTASAGSQPDLFWTLRGGGRGNFGATTSLTFAVQPYSVGGYANYLEANQSAARYFGPNLSRLSTVRRKYDPARVMFSGLDV